MVDEIKLNRDQADKMIELFRKYENTGDYMSSSVDRFAVEINSLVSEVLDKSPNVTELVTKRTADKIIEKAEQLFYGKNNFTAFEMTAIEEEFEAFIHSLVSKDEDKPEDKAVISQFTIAHAKDGSSRIFKDGVLTHEFTPTDEYMIQHWYFEDYGVIEPVELECVPTLDVEAFTAIEGFTIVEDEPKVIIRKKDLPRFYRKRQGLTDTEIAKRMIEKFVAEKLAQLKYLDRGYALELKDFLSDVIDWLDQEEGE